MAAPILSTCVRDSSRHDAGVEGGDPEEGHGGPQRSFPSVRVFVPEIPEVPGKAEDPVEVYTGFVCGVVWAGCV